MNILPGEAMLLLRAVCVHRGFSLVRRVVLSGDLSFCHHIDFRAFSRQLHKDQLVGDIFQHNGLPAVHRDVPIVLAVDHNDEFHIAAGQGG